ncbi:hypothetical protein HOA92_07200 [archaeon]|jgi:hypothetical protein|nr:hypothetical protein [archaeon]MBT6762799.1 hypothetical protein [archaeon]
MNNLVSEISKKLEFTLTASIFVVIVIKIFFELFTDASARHIELIFGFLVALNIINYGMFYLNKEKLEISKQVSKFVNHMLTINMFVMGVLIIMLILSENIVESGWLIAKIFNLTLIIAIMILIAMPILIFLFLLIGLPKNEKTITSITIDRLKKIFSKKKCFLKKYFWSLGIGVLASGLTIAHQSNWSDYDVTIVGFILLLLAVLIRDPNCNFLEEEEKIESSEEKSIRLRENAKN